MKWTLYVLKIYLLVCVISHLVDWEPFPTYKKLCKAILNFTMILHIKVLLWMIVVKHKA
jgi:hypothetical protein